MKNVNITVAANVTYSGNTFNTPLHIEYKHTGKQFFKLKAGKKICSTTDIDIAESWKAKGYKTTQDNGYYFIYRLAIPTVNAAGKKDIWYINNDGDNYNINKVSKYAKKIHTQLSNNINTLKTL